MKNTLLLSSVVAIALFVPGACVFAEEGAVTEAGGVTSIEDTGGDPNAPLPLDAKPFPMPQIKDTPRPLPPKQGGSPEGMPGSEPGSRPDMTGKNIVSPRDAASGLPTGKRMMQGSTTPTKPPFPKEGMGDGRIASGTRPLMDDRRAAAQERMTDRKIDHRRILLQKTVDRLRAAIERITKLADRLDSRLAKLSENGKNVAKAKEFVSLARQHLDDARADLTEALDAADQWTPADGTATGTPPKDPAVRSALEEVAEHLKEAHKALSDAVQTVKSTNATERKDTMSSSTSTTTP